MYATGASYASHALASAARAGLCVPDFSDSLEPQRVTDLFTVVAHDRAGFGVFLTAPRATRCETLPAKSRRAFERLAAELVAAMRLREHRGRAQAARLSAAEALVARRFLEGASDKAIALELNVAVSTVSTFARRMREKLGCRPGEELLLLSERRDLLSHGRDFASMQRRLALFERLSNSECEVASELLIGSSYSEIAERRDVSVRTVASQCAAIFRKCGVSGRRELAATLFGR
jgi:DNA-binding NarL/FixJ family response regulator